MAYSDKVWKDSPDHTTPLSAAGLNDWEARIKAETDALEVLAGTKALRAEVNIKDYGAVGDGTVRALSGYYASLAAAQAVYPFVTSLTQTIDYAAIQLACNTLVGKAVGKAGKLVIPPGVYCTGGTGIIVDLALDALGSPYQAYGLTIEGAGMGYEAALGSALSGSVIKSTMTSGAVLKNTSNWAGFTVRNLAVVGPGINSVSAVNASVLGTTSLASPIGLTGMFWQYIGGMSIENVVVRDCSAGMVLMTCEGVSVRAINPKTNRNVGLAVVSCNGVHVSASTIQTTASATNGTSELIANTLIDGTSEASPSNAVVFDGNVHDELGNLRTNSGGQSVLINRARDCSVGNADVYQPGDFGGTNPFYGVRVMGNSRRTKLHKLNVRPYSLGTGHSPTQTIIVDSGALGTVLEDIVTDPNGGGDILDNGTATVRRNVNVHTDPVNRRLPYGYLHENVSRIDVNDASTISYSSAQLILVLIEDVPIGKTISSISFAAGGAGSSMTNQVFSLYDEGLNKLAVSSDDTSTAWAADSIKTLALASSYTPQQVCKAITGVASTGVFTTGSYASGSFVAGAHNFAVGQRVQFSGLLAAAGLSEGVSYYVLTIPTANTFTVAATPGGSTVTFSADVTATGEGWRSRVLATPKLYAGLMVKASGATPGVYSVGNFSRALNLLTPLPVMLSNTGLTNPASMPAVATNSGLPAGGSGKYVPWVGLK